MLARCAEFTTSTAEARSIPWVMLPGNEAIHFIPELAHAFLECPSCQSPDFELLQGRGVSIGAIEGDTP